MAESVQEKETQHSEMTILLEQVVKANEDLKSRCDSLAEDRLKLSKELIEAKGNTNFGTLTQQTAAVKSLSDELQACKEKLAETEQAREEESLKFNAKIRDLELQVTALRSDLKKDNDAR